MSYVLSVCPHIWDESAPQIMAVDVVAQSMQTCYPLQTPYRQGQRGFCSDAPGHIVGVRGKGSPMHSCFGHPRMASTAAHLWAPGTAAHTPAPHARSQPRSHTASTGSHIRYVYDLSTGNVQAHACACAQWHGHLSHGGIPHPAVLLENRSLSCTGHTM